MKIEIIRARACMKYLIQEIGVGCQNNDSICICHYCLAYLMNIFIHEKNSQSQIKKLYRLNRSVKYGNMSLREFIDKFKKLYY